MNYIRSGKFLLALIFTCGLLAISAPVKAQHRPKMPTREDESQNDARQQRRIAPPPGLACDANHITSFTGRVLSYSRRQGRIFIRVRTDEQTTEGFTIPYGQDEDLSKWFMLDGQALSEGDLAKIESRWRRNKRHARATVWACYDNDWRKLTAEIIDWRSGVR